MAIKRGDEIPRPHPWTVRAADLSAAKGWETLVAHQPEAADRAWVAITRDPRHRDDRQHPLRGSLGSVVVAGHELEQWEFEVLGAARLRYGIDDQARVLWVTHAGIGHPKDTDSTSPSQAGLSSPSSIDQRSEDAGQSPGPSAIGVGDWTRWPHGTWSSSRTDVSAAHATHRSIEHPENARRAPKLASRVPASPLTNETPGHERSLAGKLEIEAHECSIHRYYDTETDQFLSVDPAVATTGQPYAFAGNDLLNATDPSGLRWFNVNGWQWYTGHKYDYLCGGEQYTSHCGGPSGGGGEEVMAYLAAEEEQQEVWDYLEALNVQSATNNYLRSLADARQVWSDPNPGGYDPPRALVDEGVNQYISDVNGVGACEGGLGIAVTGGVATGGEIFSGGVPDAETPPGWILMGTGALVVGISAGAGFLVRRICTAG